MGQAVKKKQSITSLPPEYDAYDDAELWETGKPVAKLIPYQANQAPRAGGQWQGQVKIAADFDILPPDIAKAFGM